MANDKPVCESREHVKKAEEVRDSNRGAIDWVMDQMGFPKEDADLKKVACVPREQYEDSLRPKLNSQQQEKVKQNVAEFSKAINTGDLTAVGELFNRVAPRAENGAKPDEFRNRSGVKIADETFYQLNKELGKQGLDFDYRSMGVFGNDRSPSLIISRERPLDQSRIEHLELTLQGGTPKEDIKNSTAERRIIRDSGEHGLPSEHTVSRVEAAAGKTPAETAYMEIMLPYRAAHRKR
ncbi:MAG: hypothetical protein C0508_16190, partial [Cyanobacteria bacterium PR.023]|jgi:hypothetical protein|nr:hypothetical protein [Cyanobacteria bacterium PR.023]MDQ5935880.1 hypothetical protein [Cyanobacteriota bacterium erpe_2018_sw_21hr_WHONDRS-SW48-000092_B_bin.40]